MNHLFNYPLIKKIKVLICLILERYPFKAHVPRELFNKFIRLVLACLFILRDFFKEIINVSIYLFLVIF